MDRLLSIWRSPKGRLILLGVVGLILFLVLQRACSHNHNHKRLTYNIAVDGSWYPLNLYGKEKSLLPFINELFEDIQADSGLHLNLIRVGTPNLIPDLDNGFYDGIISSMPANSTSMNKYQFSEPLFYLGPVAVVTAKSPIKSINDLTGRFIGIPRGQSLNFVHPLPKASLYPYDNVNSALADLEDNKLDAVIMNVLQAFVQIQGIHSGKIRIITTPLTQEGLRLVALKNSRNDDLIEMFNKSLQDLMKNGSYLKLVERWGLFTSLINNPDLEEKVK